MDLREHIKKYQGKCYKYENSRCVMYMRIVKIGEREDELYPYFVIYDFITHFTNDKDWSMQTENVEHRSLIPPEMHGWKRTTKSNYELAKKKCIDNQPKYIEKK